MSNYNNNYIEPTKPVTKQEVVSFVRIGKDEIILKRPSTKTHKENGSYCLLGNVTLEKDELIFNKVSIVCSNADESTNYIGLLGCLAISGFNRNIYCKITSQIGDKLLFVVVDEIDRE